MTETQTMLGDMVTRFLAARYPLETRRSILAGEAGWSPATWSEMADLGLLAMMLPERMGGLDGDGDELMIVMEALGRALLLEPFISSAVVGAKLFVELGDEENLSRIAAGAMRIALAHDETPLDYGAKPVETRASKGPEGVLLTGRKIVVRDAPSATHLVVSAIGRGAHPDMKLCLVPVDAEGVALTRYRTIDGVLAADIDFDEVRVPDAAILCSGPDAFPLLQKLLSAATLATCAEAIGVMREMLEQSLAYTKQREQFDKSISSFQVVQHRLVDMLIDVEQAQSITMRAVAAGDDDMAVSYAKIRVNEALRNVSHSAVQLHGAIGTTEELPLGQYFRRASVIQRQYGTSAQHYQRIEQRPLDDLRGAELSPVVRIAVA